MSDPDSSLPIPPTQRILGLDFLDVDLSEGFEYACAVKGVVVFPSGSCMERLERDPEHWESLKKADTRFVDSGALALFWRWVSGRKVKRVSGYVFLEQFIRERLADPASVYWVMPTIEESKRHCEWLREVGFAAETGMVHIAPWYERGRPVVDEVLLTDLERARPAVVVICLSGGVQEPLAVWLRNRLAFRPLILCTGAAIAFLSGTQSRIPRWADRWYVGWIFRCVENPVRYGRRYARVFRLLAIVRRFRDRRPKKD